jgi:hypothetical protein
MWALLASSLESGDAPTSLNALGIDDLGCFRGGRYLHAVACFILWNFCIVVANVGSGPDADIFL